MHLSDFDPTTVTTSGKAIMDLPQRAEATIDAWCDELFASLPRRDQRQKAVTYVKGLLRVTGRKSVRNIARSVGAGANEQQLHHFVSDSTWDWRPVRRALAGRLAADAAVQAWLVRPIDVQKAGEHSVGVSRRFCIEHGRTLNTQRAVGVWAASTAGCVPVAHRILLPTAWTADDRRRTRAGIP